jgi:outer membrane immunogenic protein
MRSYLVGGLALLALTAVEAARAADLSEPPAYKAPVATAAPSWSGVYLGLGVGTRFAQTKATMTSLLYVSPTGTQDFLAACPTCTNEQALNGATFRFNPYIGFNWQIASQWIVGLEADWGWGRQTTTAFGGSFPTGVIMTGLSVDSFAVRTTWDASARGRLGFLATPTVMIYGTGGAAWLHVEGISTCGSGFLFVFACNPAGAGGLNVFGPAVLTSSSTRLGWTIGGGVEAMLARNWFVRAEYRYADFGTISNSSTRTCASPCVLGGGNAPGFQNATYDLRVQTHTATFGVAYRFD